LARPLSLWPRRAGQTISPANLHDRVYEPYGLSNQEIAERLVISPATAKTHVSRTMMKLHAHDRAQLVVIAYESGLVRVP